MSGQTIRPQPYDAEMLAFAIVEAELNRKFDDRETLLDIAATEHPHMIIHYLANITTIMMHRVFREDAIKQLHAMRHVILEYEPEVGE